MEGGRLRSPTGPVRGYPRPAACRHPPGLQPLHRPVPRSQHGTTRCLRHLRSLWVNVSSSFAIVDGEIGPDNVFAVDPESSFDDHVV